MLSQFYEYLAMKIVNFFIINNPKNGDKFYIQFDSDDQVKNLYDELKKNTLSRPFSYQDSSRGQEYSTYELEFGSTQLIVCASINQIPHPDFLATIRNLVGVCKGYESKACLSIFSSEPDSILGGAGSLAKEGMPLNISSIEQDIRKRIDDRGYSEQDKSILEMYLTNKTRELEWETATSLFEYEDIVDCLNESYIPEKSYGRFELFPDHQLFFFTGKQLKDRLEDNHKHYVSISEIHSYGPDEPRLEKLYGESGVKRLMSTDWKEIDFSEIKRFADHKKTETVIDYFPILSNPNIWDKEEGPSKAKSRTRNILVFVDKLKSETSITLSFSDFTKSEYIIIPKEFQNVLECANSGKKLVVKLSGIEDNASFYRFKYSANGIGFDFKIAVLKCDPYSIDSIKTLYSIEIKKHDLSAIRINSEDDTIVFNPLGESETTTELSTKNSCVVVPSDSKVSVTISENYPFSEDNDDVSFTISIQGFLIPIIKTFAAEKPTFIEGIKLWYLKNTKKTNFLICGENTYSFGTKKYTTRNEFRRLIELEKKYIALGSPFAIEKYDGFEAVDISLPAAVKKAYDDIIQFFISNNTLPSLAYISTDLRNLYVTYIQSIKDVMKAIPDNSYLSDEIKGLFRLGMIKRLYEDNELLLTPLHPINIAYQLFVAEQNIEGLEEENSLIKQFQQAALLPYINCDPYTNNNVVYVPVEQSNNPEWKVYVEEALPRYKGSKAFVSKLVPEKIREFVDHFSYLFPRDARSSVRINLINTGDCKEIVQGIVNYFAGELRRNPNKQVLPLQVTLYTDAIIDTAFEKMSKIDDVEELMNLFDLRSVQIGSLGIEDIIDIYRNNVDFYVRNTSEFEYAHITFIELANDNQSITTEMDDIPSGIVMNGLSSSVPSELLGDSYRTGFGTKYVRTDSDLMQICMSYNSINSAINGDSYRSSACYSSKMGSAEHVLLKRVYSSSNWVTFINPKVDLDFFKNDFQSNDLMIINYSDQYNMSGYDAITVTQKSKQYLNAIQRYLAANGVEETEKHSKDIINIFNAINGDWLIRMLSYRNQFPVEKLSILSAIKLTVASFGSDEVIWVPVSLEEILRVSGSVGLAKGDSIFSTKNLGFEGSTSDDILLVGVKDGNPVQITFYPVEVKIGKNCKGYLAKGVNQATQTRQIFDSVLGTGDCISKPIKTRLFRNFFIQQILVNAGKLLLFNVGDGKQGWEKITDSDLRTKLVSEDYVIVDSLFDNMRKAAVVSFRNECKKADTITNNDILVFDMPKSLGINLLATAFSDVNPIDLNHVEEVFSIEDYENKKGDVSEDEETSSEETGDIKEGEVTTPEDTDDTIKVESNASDINDASSHGHSHKRVLIGKDKFQRDVYWEFGHKDLANRHVLITGSSGQGKTYAIQTMLYELVNQGVPAVIFDYTGGFTTQQLDSKFKELLNGRINQHIVYSQGVPINPFVQHDIDLDGVIVPERTADVASRLADIFVHVYKFGSQQYSAIFEAILNGLEKHGSKMDMGKFQEELKEISEENKAAKTVISKLTPFFHTVKFTNDPSFDWGNILYSEKPLVNIIQLAAIASDIQIAIIEMMLWDLWYYSTKYGTKEKAFAVVLDEAQNLSHEAKAPSSKILTEGRKFGWSAWFATQSLRVFSEDAIIRLMQPAFKMYFKPTEFEIDKIVKQLNSINSTTDWNQEVQKLIKGQCVVIGDRMLEDGRFAKPAPTVTNVASFEKRIERQL